MIEAQSHPTGDGAANKVWGDSPLDLIKHGSFL